LNTLCKPSKVILKTSTYVRARSEQGLLVDLCSSFSESLPDHGIVHALTHTGPDGRRKTDEECPLLMSSVWMLAEMSPRMEE
uniref:Uncharacterized protein n=1 Tax=Ciona intestinalis TaxID=7719 RepID=H2XU20_CIOIN